MWRDIETKLQLQLEIVCGSFQKYTNYRIEAPSNHSVYDLCLLKFVSSEQLEMDLIARDVRGNF